MLETNRLSVQDIEALLSNPFYPTEKYHIALRQLLDTLREKKQLLEIMKEAYDLIKEGEIFEATATYDRSNKKSSFKNDQPLNILTRSTDKIGFHGEEIKNPHYNLSAEHSQECIFATAGGQIRPCICNKPTQNTEEK